MFGVDFYPSTEQITTHMFADIDWLEIDSMLEPSAGKGDIATEDSVSWRLYSCDGNSAKGTQ